MAVSKAEEGKEGIFDIEDPILLKHMILTQDVKHPISGVSMLTKGNVLTEKAVQQLVNVGIKTIIAAPQAEESIALAAEQVRDYFDSVEKIIGANGMSVRNAASLFQEMASAKELEQIVRNQMENVFRYFNEHAADTLIKLNNHHPSSAHHSVITGFNAMAITKELLWEEEAVLEAVMAAMTHDIGKVNVSLETLEWPGGLNDKQREETELHTLFGGALLQQGSFSSAAMVALNHHEWFAKVDGKGYGSLTKYREAAKNDLELDVDQYISQSDPKKLEIIQIAAIADMVAALEEIRSPKGTLPPFKVLIIMNHDAKLGHFKPELFRVWHKIYTRKHRHLLPKGLRVSFPREKERVVERASKPFFQLQATIRKLTYEELERMELFSLLKSYVFDLKAIEKDNGITIDRIERRGIEVNKKKLATLEINPEKQVTVLLPAKEIRLSMDDLLDMRINPSKLAEKRVANLLRQSKDDFTLPDLAKVDIQFSKEQLARLGDRLYKKIYYDLLVVEELSASRALFAIVREGNRLEDLEKSNAYNSLDPLQSYLLNKIGLVELEFADLTTELPDMTHVVRAGYWDSNLSAAPGKSAG